MVRPKFAIIVAARHIEVADLVPPALCLFPFSVAGKALGATSPVSLASPSVPQRFVLTKAAR